MLVYWGILTSLAVIVSGFSVGKCSHSRLLDSSTTLLRASRRETIQDMTAAALLAGTALVTSGIGVDTASATDIDYSRIQDLLGSDVSSNSYQATASSQGKRPTYLLEPTEEFKQNEAKAAEFRRYNLKQKADFRAIIEQFETAPDDEEALAGSLDEMRRFVRTFNGLPEGITKKELITIIRRRKAKKYWPTNVEIAYQDLLMEIQYQQSPNNEKDDSNPL